MNLPSAPILSCDAARALESRLFGGDEAREWAAMQQAGRAIARALRADAEEMGGLPDAARILVLAGKGHNGGDALIAARALLEVLPAAHVSVVLVFPERPLRPLAARAWRELSEFGRDRVRVHAGTLLARGDMASDHVGTRADGGTPNPTLFDVCLDGVFGFQFRPPAEPRVAQLLAAVNAAPIRLRAAVDLPSAGLFRADFTYATGSVKTPVVDAPEAGRVRYLDLGFFRGDEAGTERVLEARLLQPLAGLRPVRSDKRTYGHLFVVGGSRQFPGAVLMSVLAALRSGVGLVTAFVPESVAPAFAARAPEAMWVGLPETPEGGLALEGEHQLIERLPRATAVLFGPGLGRDRETLALVANRVRSSELPLVLDADALQPDLATLGRAPRILTPHAGEFARVAAGGNLAAFVRETAATVVLKGPVTRIAAGDTVWHSFFGGPVLARGGSGDLLAGLIGGLLAQTPDAPALAAARGVVWHGRTADLLARAHGQAPVSVTQLLDFLPSALRQSAHELP